MKFRWKVRAEVVAHLRAVVKRQEAVIVNLDRALTDLAESGSWLATEAHDALVGMSFDQRFRLLGDINKGESRLKLDT